MSAGNSRIEREKEKTVSGHLRCSWPTPRSRALDRGQKVDEEASKQQSEELARVADLTKRGLASTGRTTDEQRAMVLDPQPRDGYGRRALRRRGRHARRWRAGSREPMIVMAKLPQELQAAIATLDGLGTQVEAMGEQLAFSGNMGRRPRRRGRSTLTVAIFRKVHWQCSGAASRDGVDLPVEPGDVVEITIKFELSPATPSN